MRLFPFMMNKDDATNGGAGGSTQPRYVTFEQLQEFGRNLISELRSGSQQFSQQAPGAGGNGAASKVRNAVIKKLTEDKNRLQSQIDEIGGKVQRFEQAAENARQQREQQAQANELAEKIGGYINTELKAMQEDGYQFSDESMLAHQFDTAFAAIAGSASVDFTQDDSIAAAAKEHFEMQRRMLAPTITPQQFSQQAGSAAIQMTGGPPAQTGNELVDKYRDNPAHFEAARRAVAQFSEVAATLPPGTLSQEQFVEMAVADPTIVELPGDPWLQS